MRSFSSWMFSSSFFLPLCSFLFNSYPSSPPPTRHQSRGGGGKREREREKERATVAHEATFFEIHTLSDDGREKGGGGEWSERCSLRRRRHRRRRRSVDLRPLRAVAVVPLVAEAGPPPRPQALFALARLLSLDQPVLQAERCNLFLDGASLVLVDSALGVARTDHHKVAVDVLKVPVVPPRNRQNKREPHAEGEVEEVPGVPGSPSVCCSEALRKLRLLEQADPPVVRVDVHARPPHSVLPRPPNKLRWRHRLDEVPASLHPVAGEKGLHVISVFSIFLKLSAVRRLRIDRQPKRSISILLGCSGRRLVLCARHDHRIVSGFRRRSGRRSSLEQRGGGPGPEAQQRPAKRHWGSGAFGANEVQIL
eukprot:Rhum_TRINITY_DN9082_c0_g1::Rhum_TRINITY_DN9082_c0_g1_i1::g.31428::m.31428